MKVFRPFCMHGCVECANFIVQFSLPTHTHTRHTQHTPIFIIYYDMCMCLCMDNVYPCMKNSFFHPESLSPMLKLVCIISGSRPNFSNQLFRLPPTSMQVIFQLHMHTYMPIHTLPGNACPHTSACRGTREKLPHKHTAAHCSCRSARGPTDSRFARRRHPHCAAQGPPAKIGRD